MGRRRISLERACKCVKAGCAGPVSRASVVHTADDASIVLRPIVGRSLARLVACIRFTPGSASIILRTGLPEILLEASRRDPCSAQYTGIRTLLQHIQTGSIWHYLWLPLHGFSCRDQSLPRQGKTVSLGLYQHRWWTSV